jgi:hypothetical protein
VLPRVGSWVLSDAAAVFIELSNDVGVGSTDDDGPAGDAAVVALAPGEATYAGALFGIVRVERIEADNGRTSSLGLFCRLSLILQTNAKKN